MRLFALFFVSFRSIYLKLYPGCYAQIFIWRIFVGLQRIYEFWYYLRFFLGYFFQRINRTFT